MYAVSYNLKAQSNFDSLLCSLLISSSILVSSTFLSFTDLLMAFDFVTRNILFVTSAFSANLSASNSNPLMSLYFLGLSFKNTDFFLYGFAFCAFYRLFFVLLLFLKVSHILLTSTRSCCKKILIDDHIFYSPY